MVVAFFGFSFLGLQVLSVWHGVKVMGSGVSKGNV